MVSPKQIKLLFYLAVPVLMGVVVFNVLAKKRKVERIIPPLKSMDADFMANAMRTGNMDPSAYTVSPPMERLRRGELEEAKKLITSGEDPNEFDIFGRNLVSMTAGFGEVDLLKWVLEHGGDVSKKNKEGFTPLLQALLETEQPNWGHYQEADAYPAEPVLFRRGSGSSPGARGIGVDVSTSSLIRRRGQKAFFECLSLLIRNGADVNTVNNGGRTPLYYACYDPDMFLFLWNKGARWHSSPPNGDAYFFARAGKGGRRAVVDKLLPQLPQLSAAERTAFLSGALTTRRKGLSQILIAKGCVQGDMYDTVTALTQLHYGEGLSLLKKAGVVIPETNLRLALEAAVRDGVLPDAQALLEMGTSPNYLDSLDFTPLTRAISLSDDEMVELLIKHGASTQLSDKRGNIPINVVASKSEKIQSLIKNSVHK